MSKAPTSRIFQNLRSTIPVFLMSVAILLCVACHGQRHENYPPEPDTPAPAAHSGMFVSEHGTMLFNGDGKSITIDFDKELAELTSLPSGSKTGTYVFLSGNLPPHGSFPIRYDAAHEMQITIDSSSVVIDMGFASEDGSTGQVGLNTVTPERIPMLFHKDDHFSTVLFKKKASDS
ncbi:MAG: hypothetical protein K6A35_05310 [bacterium]|nr:hypothetical protein [bacterium]